MTEDNIFRLRLSFEYPSKKVLSKSVSELCVHCLDPNDLEPMLQNGSIKYHIKNTSKYNNLFKQKALQHLDPDYISISKATEILKEYGMNLTKKEFKNTFKTSLGECLLHPKRILNNFINSKEYSYYVKEEEVRLFALYYSSGKISSGKHCIPEDILQKLIQKGWILKNNDKLFFFENRIKNKKICRTCGQIKNPLKDFVPAGAKKLQSKNPYSRGHQCKSCISEKNAQKYANLPKEKKEQLLLNSKQYRKDNIEKYREYGRIQQKQPKYKALNNIRSRLRVFMKTNDTNFGKDIGCTRKELIQHLESQFQEGMNWENYGSGENGDHVGCWHIDHIIPISKFTGKYPNHYTNLRPMWGIDNIKKGAKI